MALPDNYTDYELLGPSLYPQWRAFKKTGGLCGNDGMPKDWTLYDSSDLIECLKSREDTLFGVVGPNSLGRMQQMRELVERERRMFLNKCSQHKADGRKEASPKPGEETPQSPDVSPQGKSGGSMNSQSPSTRKGTKPIPFTLSQSPSMARKLKIIDSQQLISEMKANFEMHLRTMHKLRKEQLERELQRSTES